VQIPIVHFGGDFVKVSPMSVPFWLETIALGMFELAIGAPPSHPCPHECWPC
jgi:hypothetical protein